MPPLRFKALTLAVVFGTMVGGIMIPNVETILGLTGATMGSLICFICPALIYKKIHKNAFCSQIILWIGLGVLIISTYTTLSATQDTRTKIEAVEPGKLPGEIKEGLDQDSIKLADQNPEMKDVPDHHGEPVLPNGKEELEQPQIKVPMDVPKREEKEKPKEEVQLDRPDQGIAQPVGEAHRHEPPVPHDEVVVDEGQDREEPEQKQTDNKEVLVEENPVLVEEPAQHKPVPKQAKGDGSQEKLEDHPVKDPKILQEGVAQEDERPPYKDLQLDKQGERKGQAVGGKDGANLQLAEHGKERVKSVEETGVKKELFPPEKLEPPEADQREIRNADENADSKLEEAGKKQLDHAVLLQVIKEQQVQQKQLLEQQAKLLAVIEEQHKEIHLQKQEEGDEKPKQEILQEPFSKSKEREEDPENKMEGAAKNIPNDRLDRPLQMLDKQSQASDEQRRQQAAGPGEGVHTRSKLTGAPHKNSAAHRNDGEKMAQLPAGKNQAGEVMEPVRSDSQKAKADGLHQEKHEKHEGLKEGQDTQVVQNAQERGKHAQKADEAAERAKGQKEVLEAANAAGRVPRRESEKEPPAKEAKHEEPPDQGKADVAPKPKVAAIEQEKLEVPEAVRVDRMEKQTSLDQAQRLQAQGADGQEQMAAAAHSPHPIHANEQEPRAEDELKEQEKLPGLPEHVRAAPRDHDNGKPNRDLRLQADLDLRRRRRDLEEDAGETGGVIIGLNPLPDVKVNDLRGALETRLNQAAEGAQQALHSRQIKQIVAAEEEV